MPEAMILQARSEHIGILPIRRALPRRECRAVGPFVFLDHMGPILLPPGQGIDVPPHPHIGLSTLTYLYEGSMVHRDSLGTEIEISPGAVNWMTAGAGIAHSERSSPEARSREEQIHGLQIWVALRREDEESPAAFEHHPASQIPEFSDSGYTARIIGGQYNGLRSPLSRKDLICIDVVLKGGRFLLPETDELAIYVVEGEIQTVSGSIGSGNLVVLPPQPGTISGNGARCMLIGGERLPEQRFFYWNFVSSSRDRIVRAKSEWQEQSGPFAPRLPGENEWLPLPDSL